MEFDTIQLKKLFGGLCPYMQTLPGHSDFGIYMSINIKIKSVDKKPTIDAVDVVWCNNWIAVTENLYKDGQMVVNKPGMQTYAQLIQTNMDLLNNITTAIKKTHTKIRQYVIESDIDTRTIKFGDAHKCKTEYYQSIALKPKP